MTGTIRVAAIQTRRRKISYRAPGILQALDRIESNLDELVGLAERAAERGCQIIAFPEDTLGTLEWEAGHWDETPELLVTAERRMLARFGEVALKHGMSILCCNDCLVGTNICNTAILLSGDGEELGRYHKVQLPLQEQARARGKGFPVFEVPGVGTIGMCICYDMVFPETTRALALAGADLVFHLTMGGASMAGGDASRAAFRTRAADNFLYLVVAFGGSGSLIIGPKGQILTEGGDEPDALVFADIDPTTGRDAGDALGGITSDFRARLFRERVPEAYGILTADHPPILNKLKDVPVPSPEGAAALFAEGLTTGADAFYTAEQWLAEGKTEVARIRFEELATHFGSLWIGRASRERLAAIRKQES